MKKLLTVLSIVCLFISVLSSVNAQTTLLFEDFDSIAVHGVPSGWSTTTNRLAGGDWWDTTLAAQSSPYICYNINPSIQQILTSPTIDFTGYTADSVILYARRSGTYNATNSVEVSTDGGSNWTVIDTLGLGIPTSSPFKRYAFKIPSIVNNQSNIKFRYRNQGNGTGTTGTNRLDDFTVRGLSTTISDGAGTASVVNSSGGVFDGVNIFNSVASSAVTITVTGVEAGDLEKVKVTVPATWSNYNAGNVLLGGAFSSATNTGTGNDILLEGLTLSTTPGTIIINSLMTPNTAGAGMNGNDSWTIQTAASGGTLTNIATLPATYTTIPISNLRSGGTDGFGNSDAGGTTPVMNNQTVVVHGVVTVPNGVLASTASTSIIIQDGDYGVQVFKSSTNTSATLPLGTELYVKGLVQVFNGNTEVVPSSVASPDLFIVGPTTVPSPFVLSNATEISEANESRLVRINSVAWDSAGQTFIGSANNRGRNNFNGGAGTAYVNSANTSIFGKTIPASGDIIGAVYHRSDMSGGQQIYKISPRTGDDLGLSGDGTGTASISPTTQAASATAVAETLVVTGDGSTTLEGVSVTIPSTWTWTNTASYQISGAGFSGATPAVTGDGSGGDPYVITVTGASVTNTNTGTISIQDLNAPSGSGSTSFSVKTRETSGTLTAISSSPTVTITAGPNPFEAINSGDWNQGSVWQGGVAPGASDNVSFSTKNVVVTITDGAQCNNLTMVAADTSAGGVGAVLQFPASGATTLTVNGRLDISGSVGRPKLTSNGNNDATLICKGYVFTSVSNTTANGDRGLNMNEGTVKLTGNTSDSLRTGAGLRLGNLEIGDGTNTKTVTWVQTSSATLNIRSLTVKSNASFILGGTTYANTNAIGNFSTSGLPMLTGGITVETNGSITVNDATADGSAYINIKDGGFTNNGSVDLSSTSFTRKYFISFGDLTADTTGSNQTYSGSGNSQFYFMKIGVKDTLNIANDLYLWDSVCVINGVLNELSTGKVFTGVKATRKVVSSQPQNFGGIGFSITDAGVGADTTTITRFISSTGLSTASTKLGGNSIRRYFIVNPLVTSGLNATIEFYYRDDELNSHNPATLTLWRTTNDGTSWESMGGTVDTALRKITLSGLTNLPNSRWTASDAEHPLGQTSILVNVSQGWNMLSLPITVIDNRKTTIFPGAVSNAFAYSGGYQVEDSLVNGVGYWLKFSADDDVSISGSLRTLDTIEVSEGWNMIGSLSADVPVAEIISIPGGIVTSPFYGYYSGYSAVAYITAGKACWVKVSSNGTLILNSSATSSSANRIKIVETSELPPPPPGEVHTDNPIIPAEFSLSQNYPNPFNPSTVINYALPSDNIVTLKVYNTLGEEVATLVNGMKQAGTHSVSFDASSLTTGVYMVRITAGTFTDIKRMVLIK